MPDNVSAELVPLVPREQAENAFRDALAIFVGRGKRFRVEQLAKGIGCKPKAIYDFTSYPASHPDHRPLHFGLIVSITKFLGATFTNEWLRLAQQGAFDLPDEQPDPGELAADTSDDTAAIVRAAMDGRFDNDEGLASVGSRMITRGATLVAIGGRP